MKNVIVGTAGHVDHGKTCLIKALSGVDTDRLKEEKSRGITIELGFADLPNDKGMDIGIIDVPGHEKFVRHMLAGIGGIDIVLLIIAADEGIMPQTTEHFEILKMLKIPKGIIVVTKKDLVDDDWMEMVREDVREYVHGTFLEDAPMLEVSSQTGENIDKLKAVILSMAAECNVRREEKELFRLPVDRVFTVDGFGTVITGTLTEGSVQKGDEIMIYPTGKKGKVRNLQVHGLNVDKASAGQRTAINISGLKKEDINRGDVVAWPDSLETSRMLDVKIDMFKDTDRRLRTGSRLHFHYGSAETLCKAVLLSEEEIGKGQTAYAQLRFEEEIAVKRSDRFILRFYSPTETIGGGIILNSVPGKRKRYDEEAISRLRVYDIGTEEQVLEQLFLEESSRLTSSEQIIKKMGVNMEEGRNYLSKLADDRSLFKVSNNLYVHKKTVENMEIKVLDILDDFHKKNPINSGMPKEEFRNKFKSVIICDDMKQIEAFIDVLITNGVVKELNGMISRRDFHVEFTDKQKKLEAQLESIYKKAGVEPPEVAEVIKLDRDSKLIQQMLEAMCTSGKLQKLNYQYYMYSETFEAVMKALIGHIKENEKITLAEFRDLIGSSRKYAMLILEHTDERKITKMSGEHRVLIK